MVEDIIKVQDLDNILSCLTIFPNSPKIAVAVSGGRDSLCLALLLNLWVKTKGGEVIALIVDHKLREESTEEAQYVKGILDSNNIKAVILTRDNTPIISGLQNKARLDRYKLIQDYCKKNNLIYLFVAHHFDDQMETVLMRDSKGVSVVGNSGMSFKNINENVIILRPFLGFSRAQITKTIESFAVEWVEDPSNQNSKYTRVKIRKDLCGISNEERDSLKEKIYDFYLQRKKIEKESLVFFARGVIINHLGLINFNLGLFNEYKDNTKIYILRKLLKFASGGKFLVKIDKINIFLTYLEKFHDKNIKYSLGNCIIFSNKEDNNSLFITREVINLPAVSYAQEYDYLWDGRFLITKKNGIKKVVRTLNEEEISILFKDEDTKRYFLSELKYRNFMKALPWFFDEKEEMYGVGQWVDECILMGRESILSNVFVFIK